MAEIKHLNQSDISDIEIPGLKIEELKWETRDDIHQSIYALYQYAETAANDSINWYGKNKRSKGRSSRLLRALAIIFTTLGGLAPIISSVGGLAKELLNDKLTVVFIGQLGYLFLGLAAACIAFDRFFGFSSGWMRYITTKMSLERALSEFRMDWAIMLSKIGASALTPDQVQLMIRRLKEFLVLVNNSVEQETLTWVSEFKTNLAEIEKTAKTQSEATRPGAIAVTVTNGMDTEDGFTVTLDGMDIRVVHGTKYQIGYVSPGTHKISIKGKINGESLDASELISVSPGETAAVTLALPVKQAQP
ncbi:MAG: SLATT domain-containing protein [Ferruginibacter sp.]